MKRILVACGNGIATSTVVATKIREKCEENGIAVTVTQCKLLEVNTKAYNFDLLVTTGKFTGGNVNGQRESEKRKLWIKFLTMFDKKHTGEYYR